MGASDGYGIDDPGDDATPGEGPWVCDTDRKAAWHLRRIAEHQAEVDRVQAVAEEDMAAVRQWAEATCRPDQSSMDFHRACLIGYRHQLEEAGDVKATYRLPGGDLRRTRGRVSVQVTDTDVFLDWAEAHETTAVKRTPLVTPLRSEPYRLIDGKVVTGDGEVVPGVASVTGPDTVTVTVRPEPKGGRR